MVLKKVARIGAMTGLVGALVFGRDYLRKSNEYIDLNNTEPFKTYCDVLRENVKSNDKLEFLSARGFGPENAEYQKTLKRNDDLMNLAREIESSESYKSIVNERDSIGIGETLVGYAASLVILLSSLSLAARNSRPGYIEL